MPKTRITAFALPPQTKMTGKYRAMPHSFFIPTYALPMPSIFQKMTPPIEAIYRSGTSSNPCK